jgi:hypothetical protein
MRHQNDAPITCRGQLVGSVPHRALYLLLVVGWFCLAGSILADEPKVTKNPEGSTTTTENVIVMGMNGRSGGGGMTSKNYEKRTTRDPGGKITKVEWYHLGKNGKRNALAQVQFVQPDPKTQRTLVTTYTYRRNGTLQRKAEGVYSNKDGTLLHEMFQTYDSTGKNVQSGTRHEWEGWEDGNTKTWKSEQWDSKTQEWQPSSINSGPETYPKLDKALDHFALDHGGQSFPLKLSKSASPSPTKPPPKTISSLLSNKDLNLAIAGTGETIGHIADFKIQNQTDQPVSFVIPAMVLESSSGKNQHYACPKEQKVKLGPKQSKTVPIDGVCLDRSKPPAGKGVTGDLVINDAAPNGTQMAGSHVPLKDANKMLRIAKSKYDAAEKLQKDGELKEMPYHDKQMQKDIMVQWSIWSDPEISEITGAPPATKDDLKKVVYKQVEEKGPMTPKTKKKVDKGIDTIFEKVELTSAKAKELEAPDPFQNVELTGEKAKGGTGSPPQKEKEPQP